MQNIELLMASLEYIESHLKDDIRTEDVAEACFCSRSTLEKMFRCVNNISVHEYIVRRRMMLAARELSAGNAVSILEVALKYGYSTHESFARAFEQIWNCKPSEFRRAKYTELFPRFSAPPEKGDEYIMQRRHVDISGLYDLFQERKDCLFLCSDIKNMMRINEISRKAGDLAILEQMRRLTAASGGDDVVFRIGGDEFCILTASSDRGYAEQLAEKIKAMNGQTFEYEGEQIPLSLYAAVADVQSGARYEELFEGLHNAIKDCKPFQEEA
ncbi:MAG: helix-turn-helix domain-containing protein [Firmicutes bacterium]|nr:helix-turn-helix domain-containing protein [Bacillota bacterium]